MRQYLVQPGDTPIGIAIGYSGCPKCVYSLVLANPQKTRVVYTNGFVSFGDLHVGEVLSLPDSWFDGTNKQIDKTSWPWPPGWDENWNASSLVGLGQSLSNLYGTSVSTSDVTSTLAGACTNVTGTNCAAAVNAATTAYQQLGPAAVGTISDLAHGNIGGAMGELAPLIGATAGGVIGGPIGAAVGGAIGAGLEALFSSLFPPPPPPPTVSCDYTLWPTVYIHNSLDAFGNISHQDDVFGTSSSSGNGGPIPLNSQVGTCFHNHVSPPGPLLPPQGSTPASPDPRWLTVEEFCSGGSATLGKATASWQTINTSFNPQDDPSMDAGHTTQVLTWGDIAFAPWFGTPTCWQLPGGNAAPFSATLRGSLAVGGPYMATPPPGWQIGQPLPPPPPGTFTGYFLPMGNPGASPIGQPQLNPVAINDVIAKQGFQNMLQAGTGGTSAAVLSQNIATFVQIYAKALLRGLCESMINNRTPGPGPGGSPQTWESYPYTLLQAVAQAWNATFSNVAQYTFGLDNDIVSVVDAVIQGAIMIPGQNNTTATQADAGDPVTINIGPMLAPSSTPPVFRAVGPIQLHAGGFKVGVVSPPGAVPASAGMSTGAKWALGTLLVGGVATGGLYLYARKHHTTMGSIVKSVFHRHPSQPALPRHTRRRR